MKVAILKKSDLSVASIYDAAQPMQHQYGGPWGDPGQFMHVAVPSDIDARAAEFEWSEDNSSIVVTEDEDLAEQLATQDALAAMQVAVGKAITFGQKLITKFAAENVMLGITQDGKTGEVLDKMGPVMIALQSGSLYEAITRAKAISPSVYDSKYVTHDRLYAFINEIEAYLGLQLSL